jgi:hypothetical protein
MPANKITTTQSLIEATLACHAGSGISSLLSSNHDRAACIAATPCLPACVVQLPMNWVLVSVLMTTVCVLHVKRAALANRKHCGKAGIPNPCLT